MPYTSEDAMSSEIISRIENAGVIAVLEIDELKHAVPVARALLAGGVDSIELTLRTPVAMDAAKAIINEVPEIMLGLGTVLNTDQVKIAASSGVAFAVAPGCNPRVIAAAKEHGLPFAPGIASPTDIEIAVESGCRVLKYFPAEASGGLNYLNTIAGPYKYLGLKFIPLGGLSSANANSYLDSPMVIALGGSWLAKREMIHSENWDLITSNAMEIRKIIDKTRK